MDIDKHLQKIPFWDKLTLNEKNCVRQNSRIRTYKKNAMISNCGESCLGMSIVIQGSIRIYMLSEEGREITLFRLSNDDVCVMSASCVLKQITFETQMSATEDTELLIINSGAYSKLVENNIYARCFSYELASERFSTVVWVLQQIIFARFDQRLARFLLSYSEKNNMTEIKMTQEAIAKEVNTAREVVARMLKQFSCDGLIEIKRGSIVLKNVQKLKTFL